MLELDKVALPEGLSMEILHRDPNYNLKNPIPVDPRLKYIDIQMKQKPTLTTSRANNYGD